MERRVLWTTLPFLGISLGMLFMADWGVQILYGNGFSETATILRILSPTPFIYAVSMCFGTQFMLAFGHEKKWSKIVQATLVLNFVALGLFMPWMSATRAVAWSSLLMDCYSAGSCIYFYLQTRKELALLNSQHDVNFAVGKHGENAKIEAERTDEVK
jgi:O-antigen/teichoic acid export membrane protein